MNRSERRKLEKKFPKGARFGYAVLKADGIPIGWVKDIEVPGIS